jgi:hypothetical protein
VGLRTTGALGGAVSSTITLILPHEVLRQLGSGDGAGAFRHFGLR